MVCFILKTAILIDLGVKLTLTYLNITNIKNTFPIILAALDLSAQDKQILKVLKTIGELSAAEKAYLFHISPDFSVPENLETTYHNLFNA